LFDGYFGGLLGWRFAFFAPSIVLGIVWVLFLWLQRNRPEDVGLPPIEDYHSEPETVVEKQTGSPDETEGSWKLIVEVIESPMIILLSISYFFMKMARYGILLWTPLYLSETLKTGMSASGAIGGLFELAGLISVFLAGVASDKLLGSRRNPITIVCVLLSAVLLWTLGSLPYSRWAIGGGLFAIGFLLFPPDALVAAMAAVDFGTKKGASTAVGLVNGLGSFGAMLGGILPGFLHARWSWNAIFSMLAFSLLISALLLLPKWNALPATSASIRRERKLAFENGARAKR
jgi:OPA family sugar phosphate sensor protein UhpC-like MFS transporter